MKKMRSAWITMKDISKITGVGLWNVRNYIYRNQTSDRIYIDQESYKQQYTKNLLKKIWAVSQLNWDRLIEYLAENKHALYTQLGFIEKHIMTCDVHELKDWANKKNKILKQLAI